MVVNCYGMRAIYAFPLQSYALCSQNEQGAQLSSGDREKKLAKVAGRSKKKNIYIYILELSSLLYPRHSE